MMTPRGSFLNCLCTTASLFLWRLLKLGWCSSFELLSDRREKWQNARNDSTVAFCRCFLLCSVLDCRMYLLLAASVYRLRLLVQLFFQSTTPKEVRSRAKTLRWLLHRLVLSAVLALPADQGAPKPRHRSGSRYVQQPAVLSSCSQ
jgi:hypothetical protein